LGQINLCRPVLWADRHRPERYTRERERERGEAVPIRAHCTGVNKDLSCPYERADKNALLTAHATTLGRAGFKRNRFYVENDEIFYLHRPGDLCGF